MRPLTRADLLPLEEYALRRAAMRREVMALRRLRSVALGAHARLCFENRATMRYQVQEMLRAERIYEPDAIQAELDVYNALVPDGANWKATFLLEYVDPGERRRELARLGGIEDALWLRVDGGAKIPPIANEDLERSTPERTAAVHFLRFEPPAEAIAALRGGAPLACGVDHPNYRAEVDPVPAAALRSLLADFDGGAAGGRAGGAS